MDIEEPVFKPRYGIAPLLAVYGLPLVFFGLLCSAASFFVITSTLFWSLILALGILTSLAPFFFIRYILFHENMVIRRYLLPDAYVDYRDIQAADASAIHTNHGRIRLGNIQNSDELQEMIKRWQAARVLKSAQPTPANKARPELPVRGHGTYAVMWGLLLGIVGLYLVPASLNLDSRWVLGGIFVVVYIVYTYILPRKL